ncbi:HAD family hydrolase [Chitinophaga filiformis]|uniref:NIF family HAD-type phosphatase n=1 Tax=Chitinophaga filiformis TaxID=104663 RepID=UPI001F426EE3|nr:HAD family hydrolase [Chitinophaga filiformis]MCF6406825.1 HAD family hydrolase [Chitinophaga filiformis]
MPEKSDKLLLLDLDETLIHATTVPLAFTPDFKFDPYYVYMRPGLDQFLANISTHFTLGVWSSASDKYVEEIVKMITPDAMEWFMIWGKSRCTIKRDYNLDTYYFEKRLDKVKKKGFKLEQIIIVDDSPEKSRSNYGNAVYIEPFEGDRNDDELRYLYDYLLTLKEVSNIRTIEKRGWRYQMLGK